MNIDVAVFVIFVLLFVLWLLAEIGGNKLLRILMGCIVIAYTAFLTNVISRIIPRYESAAVMASMGKASELFDEGNVTRVNDAVKAYNKEAKSGNTYQAASEMWDVINHGQKNKE